MPSCKIDLEASPKFKKLIKNYKRPYPRLLKDLEEAFERIEKDYTTEANARAIVGFSNKVWKYRCKSTDLRKGASKALRIIAFYNEDNSTLYPMLVYLKSDQEDVSREEIEKVVSELKEALSEGPASQ